MARDVNAEPLFPTDVIQGDILTGLPKRCERLLFFSIDVPTLFKAFLKDLDITTMQECLAQRDAIAKRKSEGIETLIPTPGVNVAFTYHGFARLGVGGLDGVAQLEALRDGMAKRTEKGKLTDPPARTWRILIPNERICTACSS
jgi:hypothetical protein